MLSKLKLETSMSFRALSKGFQIIKEELDLLCECPSHTTLINWIHKIGFYKLNKIKEKGNDWIIILDESIQLGQDKILVIFGIRKRDIDFTRPLDFKDLIPLREISKIKWTGELIRDILFELKDEIGDIIYAVGDYGSDLKKGLELAGITHVHDITHKIALIFEKIFKEDHAYQEVTKKMSEMRSKYSQSNLSYLIPPKQRKKSRYQNIKIISDWCVKILQFMENATNKTDEIIESLNWIHLYKPFIHELAGLNKAICNIEKIVKHNGLSNITMKESLLELKTLTTESGLVMKNELEKYFKETIEKCPMDKKILVTSDIIESAFGKYKNYVSSNPMAGITNLVLSIAAFTATLDKNEIKTALESTKMKDIKIWTDKFIGKTLLQKRREALSPI